MTKKRALKLIMSIGVQRNEAQHLLLIEHNKGKTNQDAVKSIGLALDIAGPIFERFVEAARAFGVSLKAMADSLKKALDELRREPHEDPGD